jgi:OmpA-OmpF porin, OOP family
MRPTRKRMRPAKRAAALCLIAAISTGLAGCWNTTRENSTLFGAGTGALIGGAFGCGFANQFGGKGGDGQDYAIGCGAGVAGGALVGALLGYLMWGPPPEKWQAPVPPPPPPPPPPAAVAPAPMKEKITLRGVHFDFNKATVRPGDAAILDEAASELKAHPKVQVDVNGYCDSIGSDAYNMKLSARRAQAVTTYLVEAGIAQSRLIPHGYGKTDFVASNDTSEGRAQNRRVELVPIY